MQHKPRYATIEIRFEADDEESVVVAETAMKDALTVQSKSGVIRNVSMNVRTF